MTVTMLTVRDLFIVLFAVILGSLISIAIAVAVAHALHATPVL